VQRSRVSFGSTASAHPATMNAAMRRDRPTEIEPPSAALCGSSPSGHHLRRQVIAHEQQHTATIPGEAACEQWTLRQVQPTASPKSRARNRNQNGSTAPVKWRADHSGGSARRKADTRAKLRIGKRRVQSVSEHHAGGRGRGESAVSTPCAMRSVFPNFTAAIAPACAEQPQTGQPPKPTAGSPKRIGPIFAIAAVARTRPLST